MKLIESLSQFLITQWVWSVTFARALPLVNMLVTLLFLVAYAKVNVVAAVLYAFFSQLFAVVAFTFFVHGFVDKVVGFSFSPHDELFLIHPLATTFLLAMIYTALQRLFFCLLSYVYRLPVQKYTLAVFFSNIVSLFIVYKFMPLL